MDWFTKVNDRYFSHISLLSEQMRGGNTAGKYLKNTAAVITIEKTTALNYLIQNLFPGQHSPLDWESKLRTLLSPGAGLTDEWADRQSWDSDKNQKSTYWFCAISEKLKYTFLKCILRNHEGPDPIAIFLETWWQRERISWSKTTYCTVVKENSFDALKINYTGTKPQQVFIPTMSSFHR